MSKPPVVTTKPQPPVPVSREPEPTVTLFGVSKVDGRFMAVEATLSVSKTQPLQFGNRKVGTVSWMTARNQCDIEQRRRETLKTRLVIP